MQSLEIYNPYIKLKQQGKIYQGICPFHSEKNPSFTVFDNGRFKCFGCGISGTPNYFLKLMGKGDNSYFKNYSQHSQKKPIKAEKAAIKAQAIWNKAIPFNLKTEPYFKALEGDYSRYVRKGYYQKEPAFIVPCYKNRKIAGIQFIPLNNTANKRFLSGFKAKGSYLVIGNFNAETKQAGIAEGLRTSLAVYEIYECQIPIFCSFASWNMPNIAQKLSLLKWNFDILLFGDPDEAGRHGVDEAVKMINGKKKTQTLSPIQKHKNGSDDFYDVLKKYLINKNC
jgi:phage/plasmid primase-like uncharacterized protein